MSNQFQVLYQSTFVLQILFIRSVVTSHKFMFISFIQYCRIYYTYHGAFLLYGYTIVRAFTKLSEYNDSEELEECKDNFDSIEFEEPTALDFASSVFYIVGVEYILHVAL